MQDYCHQSRFEAKWHPLCLTIASQDVPKVIVMMAVAPAAGEVSLTTAGPEQTHVVPLTVSEVIPRFTFRLLTTFPMNSFKKRSRQSYS
jgi:hypothetical protein